MCFASASPAVNGNVPSSRSLAEPPWFVSSAKASARGLSSLLVYKKPGTRSTARRPRATRVPGRHPRQLPAFGGCGGSSADEELLESRKGLCARQRRYAVSCVVSRARGSARGRCAPAHVVISRDTTLAGRSEGDREADPRLTSGEGASSLPAPGTTAGPAATPGAGTGWARRGGCP